MEAIANFVHHVFSLIANGVFNRDLGHREAIWFSEERKKILSASWSPNCELNMGGSQSPIMTANVPDLQNQGQFVGKK